MGDFEKIIYSYNLGDSLWDLGKEVVRCISSTDDISNERNRACSLFSLRLLELKREGLIAEKIKKESLKELSESKLSEKEEKYIQSKVDNLEYVLRLFTDKDFVKHVPKLLNDLRFKTEIENVVYDNALCLSKEDRHLIRYKLKMAKSLRNKGSVHYLIDLEGKKSEYIRREMIDLVVHINSELNLKYAFSEYIPGSVVFIGIEGVYTIDDNDYINIEYVTSSKGTKATMLKMKVSQELCPPDSKHIGEWLNVFMQYRNAILSLKSEDIKLVE